MSAANFDLTTVDQDVTVEPRITKKRPLDAAQLLKRREDLWNNLVDKAETQDQKVLNKYREDGFCIVADVFKEDMIEFLLKGAKEVEQPVLGNDESSRPCRRVRLIRDTWPGAEQMIQCNRDACAPRSKGRYDLQLPPSVLPKVQEALDQCGVSRIIRSIIPKAEIRTSNVMLCEPGAEEQPIHTDSCWKGVAHVDPLPHYLTVLIPLVKQTKSTGGTRVWPGTHRNYNKGVSFAPGSSNEMLHPMLKIGDALIFDGLLSHCGMKNTSKTANRYFFYMAFSTRHDPNTELTSWI